MVLDASAQHTGLSEATRRCFGFCSPQPALPSPALTAFPVELDAKASQNVSPERSRAGSGLARLVRAVVALVADANEDGRAHVGVTNDADTVVLFAEATDGDSRLFATHDEIRMMLRHVT
jgi:hypothetical protein